MHLGKVRKLNLVITWWFFFNTFWSFRTVFLYHVTQYVSKLKEIINHTEHLNTELGLFCTHKKGCNINLEAILQTRSLMFSTSIFRVISYVEYLP